MTITLFLGVLIGAVMGLTGAGGGILAVPALMIGLGWTPQQAAPVALLATLLATLLAASVGALEGLRHGQVRYRAALLIGFASLPFSNIGLRVAHALPAPALLWILAALLLTVGLRLIRQPTTDNETLTLFAPHTPGHLDRDSGRFEWNAPTAILFATLGSAAGFMSGLLGVGGGFIVVPLLRRYTDASLHTLIATSLLIVALISLGSLGNALAHGASLPPHATTAFATSLIIGMLLGRRITHQLQAKHVQRIFALLLLIVAAGMSLKAVITPW